MVGIEILVDGRVGLLDLGMRGRLEVHVQVLREVPADGEVAIPEELLRKRQRQVGVLGVLEVALLQLIVVARELRVERDVLGQIVQSDGLWQLHPLRF